jgi:hypothetical protein
MKRKKLKPYWEMTTAELREATKEFDKEFVPTRPLSTRMRAQLRRARLGPGRPKIGKGAKSVLISVEQGLLEDADAFARKYRLSRSELFARGLRTVLKAG